MQITLKALAVASLALTLFTGCKKDEDLSPYAKKEELEGTAMSTQDGYIKGTINGTQRDNNTAFTINFEHKVRFETAEETSTAIDGTDYTILRLKNAAALFGGNNIPAADRSALSFRLLTTGAIANLEIGVHASTTLPDGRSLVYVFESNESNEVALTNVVKNNGRLTGNFTVNLAAGNGSADNGNTKAATVTGSFDVAVPINKADIVYSTNPEGNNQ